MRNKVLSALLFICFISFCANINSVRAETSYGTVYGKLVYKISNNEVRITDCSPSFSGELIIPAEIDGFPVTSISTAAFFNCAEITQVTIPATLTTIQENAFNGCHKLTKINIPDSVLSIGRYAFANCPLLSDISLPNNLTLIEENLFDGCLNLTNIFIPENVTSIERRAFNNCSKLTTINIPDKVSTIADRVFDNCNSLTEISVSENNLYYTSLDGVIFNKDKTTLHIYPCGKTGKFTFPDSVISIGKYAFSHCYNLTDINFPDTVLYIENYAFNNCSMLTEVTLPNNLTTINNYIFKNCINLTDINIPKNISSISLSAFSGCTKLTNINVDKNNRSFSSLDGILFDKQQKTLIFCPYGKTGDYEIPKSVVNIADDAFYKCTNLTNIFIPDSVTFIGDYAFDCCLDLTKVSIPNSITHIGEGAFEYCPNLATTYYYGTPEEWSTIDIGEYNESLTRNVIFIKHIRANKADDTIIVEPVNVESGTTVIIALYDGDTLSGIIPVKYTGEIINITPTKAYTNAKVIAWEDLAYMNPVCEAVEL